MSSVPLWLIPPSLLFDSNLLAGLEGLDTSLTFRVRRLIAGGSLFVMRMARSSWIFAILIGALVAGTGGCARKQTAADEAIAKGIFLKGNGAEPKGLDPHLVTGVTENKIITALIEGLVTYHPVDDNLPEPGMAERWEHSEGYRVWKFFIRENARWSNGDPVTAADFVYSHRRMLHPDLGAEYANELYLMENASAYHQGQIGYFLFAVEGRGGIAWDEVKDLNWAGAADLALRVRSDVNSIGLDHLTAAELAGLNLDAFARPAGVSIELLGRVVAELKRYRDGGSEDLFRHVGVKALDARTLEYRLIGPAPFFTSKIKHYSWFPVHPPTIEKFGGATARATEWTRPGQYVGNGPFVLSKWVVNQVVEVTKSPTYWDRDRVSLNAIHFFPIENINTESQAFLAGQLHYTNEVPSQLVPTYRQQYPDKLRIDPYLGTYFYRFNVTRAPLNDVRVRRALALAVDQKLIVERITQGDQTPAYAMVPPGVRGYESAPRVAFDPDRARALLAEAGFPGGQGWPSGVEILINTSENHRRIAEAVQQMWKTELGVDIGVVNQEWKVYLDSQSNLNYWISRSGWIGDYIDPMTFLEMWTTGNGNNDTGWSSPQYDGLISAATLEPDPTRRLALLQEAEGLFLDEMPIAPIYWYTRVYLIDPRVQGWVSSPLDNRPYKYISFETPAP